MSETKLTEHFTLEELTITGNAALQEANRILTGEQLAKLLTLAEHCELIRKTCGERPLKVHSGYRSLALNAATLGSSSTSQHPRCEAVDFDVPGQELQETFELLRSAAKAGNFEFGQLILEYADRGYKNADGSEAISRWVHCSVVGTLELAKIGQVLEMHAGPDGKPHYELIEKLDFNKEGT